MQIRITTIPAQGMEIQDKLSKDNLNARMNESKGNEIFFLQDPIVNVLIRKQVNGAELSGSVKAVYQQPCSLCAKEVEIPLQVKLAVTLKPTDPENPHALEDDVGIVTFTGEHIDLVNVLEEHIILNLSPYLRPEKDASGKCLLCGEDPSKKFPDTSKSLVSFGDLLKKVK